MYLRNTPEGIVNTGNLPLILNLSTIHELSYSFSDDIHMEFGFDNCAQIVLKRGKLVHSQNLILDFEGEIQEPE
jgi:hypothetical protein